jgi:UDP-glucose 4-epimerase
MANPALNSRNNVVGTLTLLDAIRDHGVKSLVFSSTYSVYSVLEAVPISEAAPLQPISPHG